MRQAGVLAAPGLIALRDGPSGMIERLAEDHENARRLAAGLVELPAVTGLDPARVRTNFVFFRVRDRDAFIAALRTRGVLTVTYPHDQVRVVTHYGISGSDVDRVLAITSQVLREIDGSARPGGPREPAQGATPPAVVPPVMAQ